MADETDDKDWKDSPPPAGWQPTGAPPGAPGGRPTEGQQATALGPSTMQASRAQTMAPLTPDTGGNLPGTLGHAVHAGYREPAEDPDAQVKGSEIGGYMGMLGGVGGGIRSIADKGIRAAAGPIIRGVSGAVAGSAAGGYGGRQIGGMISKGAADTGGHIGSVLGGLGGGLYGGMGLNEPAPEAPFSKVSESSGPYRGPSSVQSPFEVPASSSTVPEPRIAPGPAVPAGGLPAEGAGPKLFQGGGGGPREPGRVGNEGSAARFTNQSAYDKAGKGSREAIMTLGRRGIEPPPNSRYIMGDVDTDRVVYNPRETTRFGPTGEPIRNMDVPEKGNRSVIAPPGGTQGTQVPVPGNGDITDREVHDRLLQMREEKLKQDIGKYEGHNDRRSATSPKGPRTKRPGQ